MWGAHRVPLTLDMSRVTWDHSVQLHQNCICLVIRIPPMFKLPPDKLKLPHGKLDRRVRIIDMCILGTSNYPKHA